MKQRKLKLTSEKWHLDDGVLSLKPSILFAEYKSQHFAFLCICAYLFFDYVKPDQQYAIFAILPFLMLSVAGALLGWYFDKSSKLQFSKMHFLLLLLLFHNFLTCVLAYDQESAYTGFPLIRTSILLAFMITAIVNSERRLFLFVLVYFLANFRMSQFGFLSWVKRGFSFADYGVTGAGWFRNSGELGMEMAMFFAYTVCFAFFLRDYWGKWIRRFMYFVPITALGCVLASSSRGAIVAAVGALAYLAMFSNKKMKGLAGAVVVLGVAYYFLPAEFLARFQSAGEDKTSLSRIYYWGKAREMMADHPFFGVGYYNWYPYFRDRYYDPEFSGNVELAHNTFLQIGAETGYVGLAIFILLCVASFWINWRTEILCRRPGFEFLRSFAMGMNAAGVALIVASNFLTATYIPSFWMHFTFTICVSQIARSKLRLLEVEEREKKRQASVTSPVSR
ncbi:O-antigen polymerase [gamma proteobacterium HdN1]|nr:O-antigen polymerase [gamma proteobacterium HdN1]